MFAHPMTATLVSRGWQLKRVGQGAPFLAREVENASVLQ